MNLTLKGGDCPDVDNCPRFFESDRGTPVVQGAKVPGIAGAVEVPTSILETTESGRRVLAGAEPTGTGTVIVRGAPVDDPEALEQLHLPDYETAVEIVPVGVS